MNKEIISAKQAVSIMILFIIGSTLVIGMGSSANQDAWLGVVVGIVFALPIILIYSRIIYLFPNEDLFDILEIVFGKIIGKIISILYIWFAFHLGTLVFRNFGEFSKIEVFPDTPMSIPLIPLVILCIWGVKEGIEVLGRASELFLAVVIINILLTLFLSIPKMDLNNIYPVLYNGIKPVLMSGFSVFAFPFAETVIFTMIFSSLKKGSKGKAPYKVYIVSLLIGGGLIFISTLRNILLLGAEMISIKYFPSYVAVRLLSIGNAFERLELAVSLVFLIGVFIKIAICLLAVCNGIGKVLGINDKRFIATPVALLMFSFSILIYENTMEMIEWAFDVWSYYAFIFQVIFPVIILIGAEIKVRRGNIKLV